MSKAKTPKGLNEKQVTELVRGVLASCQTDLGASIKVLDALEAEFRRLRLTQLRTK